MHLCASQKKPFQTSFPTTLKAAEATMGPITSVRYLVEHFRRLPCSHPSSAAAIKSNKLSHGASLLSIKHLREPDKAAAAVKKPSEGRGESCCRRTPTPGGSKRVRRGSRPWVLFVITAPVCRGSSFFSSSSFSFSSSSRGDKTPSAMQRSEFEGRHWQRAVTVGGAHFSAAPQGQVFGPLGFLPRDYGQPPFFLSSSLSLSFLHLCDRKCPCDTSFDWLYNAPPTHVLPY